MSEMQKRHVSWSLTLIAFMAMFLLGSFSPARAAEKTFSVLPFTVHGPDKYRYLQQGIPSMLNSRLTWEDRFEPAQKAPASEPPENKTGAQRIKAGSDVDFLIWGSVTVMGDQASLDVSVLDENDELHAKNRQTGLNTLIPALEEVAAEINAEVFERKPKKAEQEPEPQQQKVSQDLVYSQGTDQQQGAINPRIRYQGGATTEGRWRSQSLRFVSHGMVMGDADADGANEIFMLENHAVHAYRFKDNKLAPLGTHSLSARIQCLSLDYVDMNRDGFGEIVVSAYRDDETDLHSFILNFRDGGFQVVHEGVDLYLGVARVPPTYTPRLIGQKQGLGNDLFAKSVHEVIPASGELTLGPSVPLPSSATVFNFAFLPEADGGHKTVLVSKDELYVFNKAMQIQAKADGTYAATGMGLEVDGSLPGLGKSESDRYKNYHYIPTRLVPFNLEKDDRFELLVSRNYSVAQTFFRKYRDFPQSEVHCLYWDGLGLSLHWKTRLIKGTLADYGLGDLDNDGTLDLYACVVTHPGATGLKNRKTVVLGYPLDVDKEFLQGQGFVTE